MGRITAITRFPVKGLSPEPLTSVALAPGAGLPGDRGWGFLRPGTPFDPDAPAPLPKDKFVVLLREAGLAGLHARLEGEVLSLGRGANVARFDLRDAGARAQAADHLATLLGLEETPRLVSAHPHRFTDVSVTSPQMMNAVSVLSRASVEAMARDIAQPLDPARFRMNIEVEGWLPWAELAHVGGEMRLGPIRATVLKRTQRCAATEVNPATAARDLPVPRLLRKTYGHLDMGVYVEVTSAGTLSLGDSAELVPRA